MPSSVQMDEFVYNLDQLIRNGYLQGLPLSDLELKYRQYFKTDITIESIMPDMELTQDKKNWKHIFKNSDLKKKFVVKKYFSKYFITLRDNSRNETDLIHILNLSSYENYLTSLSSNIDPANGAGAAFSPSTSDTDWEMATSRTTPSPMGNFPAEDTTPHSVAALALAKHILESIPGQKVIDVVKALGVWEHEGSLTPSAPAFREPEMVMFSPKEAESSSTSTVDQGRQEPESLELESESESQLSLYFNSEIATDILQELHVHAETNSDSDPPATWDMNEEFDSLIGTQLEQDESIDTLMAEDILSMFDVEIEDLFPMHDEIRNSDAEISNMEPIRIVELQPPVMEEVISTEAPELDTSPLHLETEITDSALVNSADHLKAQPRPRRRVANTSSGRKDMGSGSKSMKKRKRKIKWHRCVVGPCSRKFKREDDWWRHARVQHANDDF